MKLRYACEDDSKEITQLLFRNFSNKFISLLPNNPIGSFPLFEAYYKYGLKRVKNNVILSYDSSKEIIGILVLEGLGIPIISLNPPPRILLDSIRILGIKSFLRIILGLLLIEGYPPDKRYLYINTVAVASKYRKKKIGYKLMKLAELFAEKRKRN